jgi:hypothetical protein
MSKALAGVIDKYQEKMTASFCYMTSEQQLSTPKKPLINIKNEKKNQKNLKTAKIKQKPLKSD